MKDGMYNAHVCGQGEMCADEGYCVCMTGYRKINDTCQLGHDPSIPYIIDDVTGTVIISSCYVKDYMFILTGRDAYLRQGHISV